jgi:putative DNA primase/helicase
VNFDDVIHYFTGTHYKTVNNMELKIFLIEAAVQCDVPQDMALYHTFVDKIFKQFLIHSARQNGDVAVPDTSYINLKNGTLFFDKKGHRFEPHSHKRAIRYCLHFIYDPKATAPLWQKHLDRSLPHPEKQRYLAECLALPFYQGKIEKAPLCCGRQDTGKSTTLDTVKALIGTENYTTESLAALTKTDSQGDYARARLDGKLVNIASDISANINDEGMTKMLISREAVPARHPYGTGFDMRNYARLIFAMNDPPPQFFIDAALTKRAAIVEFDKQISPEEKDTGFVERIIADELPGVLNWVITGLDRLLQTGRLDAPACCLKEMEQIQKEVDPVRGWLDENGYQKGKTAYVILKTEYLKFVEYCKENGNQAPSKKKFTLRLKGLGYEVGTPNGHTGTVIYYTKPSPQCPAPCPIVPLNQETPKSPDSATSRLDCLVHSPVHSPLVPLFEPTNTGMGNEGSEGSENSAQSLNCVESECRPPNMVPVSLREKGQVVETPQGLVQKTPVPYGGTRIEKIK